MRPTVAARPARPQIRNPWPALGLESRGVQAMRSERRRQSNRQQLAGRPGERRHDELVIVSDLVKERIAQAVGVRIPLTRPLVGGERCRPQRVGAGLAPVHRQVEAVAEKHLRPFPPGAELPHPAQQGRNGRSAPAPCPRVTDPNTRPDLTTRLSFAHRRAAPAFQRHGTGWFRTRNRTRPSLNGISTIDHELVRDFFSAFGVPGMDRAVVLDAPGIDAALAQRAHQFAAGRAGHQQLVALGPVPDDLDHVGQVGRIGKRGSRPRGRDQARGSSRNSRGRSCRIPDFRQQIRTPRRARGATASSR